MKFDEIDDALDIVKDTSEPIEIDNVKPIKCDKDDLDRDYEYTRGHLYSCLLYTSPSPRDLSTSRMPSSA